ncbi:hypothetical protein KGA66_28175 [Actinocrinis puniceicyclus]|uniref:Uncharacterized protein n=1 Tax=Actinocrinis puniceicyclus TaxID=977794 RepID=A0A8J7WVK6_9ACTN|nr:hypothetical protein [Actinocrinis puniceicyclus]MBS2966944.1 hypothetical protein [Actinocrinis puniceicyclus]
MQLFVTVAHPASAASVDLLVDTAESTPVAEVDAMLRAQLGLRSTAGEGMVLCADGAALDPDEGFGAAPVRDGSVLSWQAPPMPAAEPGVSGPTSLVEVRVAGGPDAGAVFPLPAGVFVLGHGAPRRLRVLDPTLGEAAVGIEVESNRRCAVYPARGVRALLDGAPIAPGHTWTPGVLLSAGGSAFELAAPTAPDAVVHPSEDGTGLDYNRPPRLLPPDTTALFALPARPAPPDRRPLPLVMALAPMALSAVLVVTTHRLEMAAFALLGPMVFIGNALTDRRHGTRAYAKALGDYQRRRAAVEIDARQALDREIAARRSAPPDPGVALASASEPGRRLWERRRTDTDFLQLRVGTAHLPAQVVLEGESEDGQPRGEPWLAADVPMAVGLRERGVLGIAGPVAQTRALGRWILAP